MNTLVSSDHCPFARYLPLKGRPSFLVAQAVISKGSRELDLIKIMKRHDHHRDATDEAFDSFLKSAVAEYVEKQERFRRKTSAFPRWYIDIDSLTLTFEGHSGESLVTSFVPVATYLPSLESWAWVWANDAWPVVARDKAAVLKQLTQTTQYQIFSTAFFRAAPDDIDELCALSVKQLDASAIFKIKDQEPWLFVAVQ